MLRLTVLAVILVAISATPLDKKAVKTPFKKFDPRIVGGDAAELGDLPWQAGLLVTGASTSWFCGGSIIAEEWILTAGHCVEGAVSAKVYTGLVDLDLTSSPSVSASNFIQHEDYDAATLSNDIGLVQLDDALEFDENTHPIELAPDRLQGGERVTISGWGVTGDNATSVSPVLNSAEVEIISPEDCEDVFGELNEGLVCASSQGEDDDDVTSPCTGDSGGPVVVRRGGGPGGEDQGQVAQVAIITFVSTRGCESGDPSGYTRVSNFFDWIFDNIGGDDGPPTDGPPTDWTGPTDGTWEPPTDGTWEPPTDFTFGPPAN